MRTHEILRNMMNKLDRIQMEAADEDTAENKTEETNAQPAPANKNGLRKTADLLEPVEVDHEEHTDFSDEQDNPLGKMLSPHQQQLELLKKVAGIESEFDTTNGAGAATGMSGEDEKAPSWFGSDAEVPDVSGENAGETHADGEDPLDKIKKMAGISILTMPPGDA